MAIPSEYKDQSKVVGSSAIKHPIYTFQVNLDRAASESVGPKTNSKTVTLLYPDQHQTSGDTGRSATSARTAQIEAYFPGLLGGSNVSINDDGTITAYGQKALYLKNTYTTGTNPLLTLTNSAPYTSA